MSHGRWPKEFPLPLFQQAHGQESAAHQPAVESNAEATLLPLRPPGTVLRDSMTTSSNIFQDVTAGILPHKRFADDVGVRDVGEDRGLNLACAAVRCTFDPFVGGQGDPAFDEIAATYLSMHHPRAISADGSQFGTLGAT